MTKVVHEQYRNLERVVLPPLCKNNVCILDTPLSKCPTTMSSLTMATAYQSHSFKHTTCTCSPIFASQMDK